MLRISRYMINAESVKLISCRQKKGIVTKEASVRYIYLYLAPCGCSTTPQWHFTPERSKMNFKLHTSISADQGVAMTEANPSLCTGHWMVI